MGWLAAESAVIERIAVGLEVAFVVRFEYMGWVYCIEQESSSCLGTVVVARIAVDVVLVGDEDIRVVVVECRCTLADIHTVAVLV